MYCDISTIVRVLKDLHTSYDTARSHDTITYGATPSDGAYSFKGAPKYTHTPCSDRQEHTHPLTTRFTLSVSRLIIDGSDDLLIPCFQTSFLRDLHDT
jgi:hypothetical protein